MSFEDASHLIDAFSKLAGTLIWPGLLAFLVIRYEAGLQEFFENLSEFSFKGAGFEASAKRIKAEASAALAAATVARRETGSTPEASAKDVTTAAAVVHSVTSRTLRRARGATVLWVDDRPTNNIFEGQALQALGMKVEIAKSTEEALAKTERQRFDVIISDMGRPPDPQAGYTLLDKLRKSGDATPFIIYAGSRAPEHVAESRRRGAMGCTNRPDELFEYVLSALNREG